MAATLQPRRYWRVYSEKSQGVASFTAAMREFCADTASMAGVDAMKCAEGFRQHSRIGFIPDNRDLHSEMLGDAITKGQYAKCFRRRRTLHAGASRLDERLPSLSIRGRGNEPMLS